MLYTLYTETFSNYCWKRRNKHVFWLNNFVFAQIEKSMKPNIISQISAMLNAKYLPQN